MATSRYSRSRASRTQSALLVLLLVVTFIATGLLTWEGQRAVAKILRDNAAFAAQRYVEFTQGTVRSFFAYLFFDVRASTELDLGHVDWPELSFAPELVNQCECDPRDNVALQFAYDFAADSLVLKQGVVSPAERARLVGLLRNHPVEAFRAGWQMAMAASTPWPDDGVVAFVVRQDMPTNKEDPPPPRQFAFGFITDTSIVRDVLMKLDSLNAKMPSSDPHAARDQFALAVYSRDQIILQGGEASRYAVEAHLEPAYGGMKVRISVNPAAVPNMAGTAVPAMRLPVLVGLLLLAGILMAAVIILTKRQSELAAARQDFVSSVSHELRTPLAQIRMFTETLLLGRTRNEVERRRSLEIIDQETRRLSALVENVLHLTRAERGVARLSPAATELAPAVRDVVDSFAQLPRSRSTEFRLELEERLVATVDTNALRQILLNLLENATKYGPSNQRVSVGLAMFDEHARFWVDDEGPGIPVRERERVFETFYRTPEHAASSIAGSGIGLAVVRELAGSLGGRTWIADAPGGGARVVVEFPNAYLRAEEATGSTVAVA